MRLFVAVDLDPVTRRAVHALATRVQEWAVLEGVTMRWVRAAQLHVTLHFLGEVPASQADRIAEAFPATALTPAFPLTLEGLGAFPLRGPPRVVWVGVSDGGDSLASLFEETRRWLDTCGQRVDPGRLRPHVTIARVKRGCRRGGADLRRELAGADVVLPTSRVERVVLYESRLDSSGARHRPLRYVSLAAPPPR